MNIAIVTPTIKAKLALPLFQGFSQHPGVVRGLLGNCWMGCTSTETAAGFWQFFLPRFFGLFWDGGYRAVEDIGLKRILGRTSFDPFSLKYC